MNSHVDCVMTPLVLAFVDPPKIQTSKYPQSKTYKRYDVVKNSFLVEVIKSNLDKRAQTFPKLFPKFFVQIPGFIPVINSLINYCNTNPRHLLFIAGKRVRYLMKCFTVENQKFWVNFNEENFQAQEISHYSFIILSHT